MANLSTTAKLLLLLPALFLLCSCHTYRSSVGEQLHRIDTVFITHSLVDTLRLHDSIHVREYALGDTVYRDRNVFHTVYRGINRIDTVHITHVDTVRITRVLEDTEPASHRLFRNFVCPAFCLFILIVLWRKS